jgi:hypothetical protein
LGFRNLWNDGASPAKWSMLRLLGVLKRLEANGRHLLGLNRCASQQIASLDFRCGSKADIDAYLD